MRSTRSTGMFEAERFTASVEIRPCLNQLLGSSSYTVKPQQHDWSRPGP